MCKIVSVHRRDRDSTKTRTEAGRQEQFYDLLGKLLSHKTNNSVVQKKQIGKYINIRLGRRSFSSLGASVHPMNKYCVLEAAVSLAKNHKEWDRTKNT